MLLQLPEQKLHGHLVMALRSYARRPHGAARQQDHGHAEEVTELPELLLFGGFFLTDTPKAPLLKMSASRSTAGNQRQRASV